MKDYEAIVRSLIEYPSEEEWFEFKENWYEPHALGEYISAISNSAAIKGKDYGFFVWGINDKSHEVTGTNFNHQRDHKHEPLEHYLARNTMPDIGFKFHNLTIDGKKVVLLEIPAASKVPTSFDGVRYIRIGSSKVRIDRYPEREAQLFDVLRNGLPTIENTRSDYQDLTFERLFTYFAGRGITLRQETFKKNLGLLTNMGEYNIMAQLLSDDCHLPVRVSIFRGKTKGSPLYSVKEFGNTCILSAMDKILDYGDVINLIQADEENRGMVRKDVPLFDIDAFREAVINAFVHNKWVDGNAPMITIYSDRMEILSRGSLAPKQTLEGFYLGESVPVNQKLSDIFLQLHISERSGRGVPKITEVYGKEAFEFRENSIVVILPFNYLDKNTERNVVDKVVDNVVDKVVEKDLNNTQKRVYLEICNNPNITQPQLVEKIRLGKTTIQKSISALKEKGYIERIGSRKKGYWKVL